MCFPVIFKTPTMMTSAMTHTPAPTNALAAIPLSPSKIISNSLNYFLKFFNLTHIILLTAIVRVPTAP